MSVLARQPDPLAGRGRLEVEGTGQAALLARGCDGVLHGEEYACGQEERRLCAKSADARMEGEEKTNRRRLWKSGWLSC